MLATGILLTRIVDPDSKSYAIEDTGFANLIARPAVTFLTVAPPIFIGLLPELSSHILGWACIAATAILLLIGAKFKWFTPGIPLPKGKAYQNIEIEPEAVFATK